MAKANQVKRYSTKLDDTDNGIKIYDGLVEPGLHVITAPIACGKSSLLVDFSVWALLRGHKVVFDSLDMREDVIIDRFVVNSTVTSGTPSSARNIYFKSVYNNSFVLSTLKTFSEITKAFKKLYNRPKKDILVIDGGERIEGYSRELLQELRNFAKKNKVSVVVSLRCSDNRRKQKYKFHEIADTLKDEETDGWYKLELSDDYPVYRTEDAEMFRMKNEDGTNYDFFLLKPVFKFYSAGQLCDRAIKSIINGVKN